MSKNTNQIESPDDKNNYGKKNIGLGNQGSFNYGDLNRGDFNNGNNNFGVGNIGNYNRGFINNGSDNFGDSNQGNNNHGSFNIGNNICGYYNIADNAIGCFCTEPNKYFFMFNKFANITVEDFIKSEAFQILKYADIKSLAMFCKNDVQEFDRLLHENLVSWNSLSIPEQNIIKSMPNFDKVIFKKITGIDVDVVFASEEEIQNYINLLSDENFNAYLEDLINS